MGGTADAVRMSPFRNNLQKSAQKKMRSSVMRVKRSLPTLDDMIHGEDTEARQQRAATVVSNGNDVQRSLSSGGNVDERSGEDAQGSIQGFDSKSSVENAPTESQHTPEDRRVAAPSAISNTTTQYMKNLVTKEQKLNLPPDLSSSEGKALESNNGGETERRRRKSNLDHLPATDSASADLPSSPEAFSKAPKALPPAQISITSTSTQQAEDVTPSRKQKKGRQAVETKIINIESVGLVAPDATSSERRRVRDVELEMSLKMRRRRQQKVTNMLPKQRDSGSRQVIRADMARSRFYYEAVSASQQMTPLNSSDTCVTVIMHDQEQFKRGRTAGEAELRVSNDGSVITHLPMNYTTSSIYEASPDE